MESAAVQLPRYVVFDLSGVGLRCFTPPPPAEHLAAVPFDTQAMSLQALHRTRPAPRGDLVAAHRHRPVQVATATDSCGHHGQLSDPDTVSDAGTSGVLVAGESEDEADSSDEAFFEERFARKIEALAELVGMKGAHEPAAVLGEVVRVLQEIDGKKERSVCAARAL